MAAISILYTNTQAIRSAIGLDENDLSDELLTSQFLDLWMTERLLVILPDHAALSVSDPLILNQLKLWGTFYCALKLIQDASLGIPMKIQVNTDSMQRFNIDFARLEESLTAKVRLLEGKLNPAALIPAVPVLAGLAHPSYDPVVGPV